MAGADLKGILASLERMHADKDSPVLEFSFENRLLRRMETGGKPFVAAINGFALGGGLELALACHYRVLSQARGAVVGLPEVTVGLLPGAGGTQRLPRMIGIEAALPILVEGASLSPEKALASGVVDELAPPDEVVERARQYVLNTKNASQPWDREGYKVPGGTGALSDHVMRSFYAGMAKLRSRTQGNYPAPVAIMSAVYEGTMLPFDQGMAVESDYFGLLARDMVSRNLIRTQFVHRKAYEGLAHRPEGVAPFTAQKIGVLGAGMMGVGIAYSLAKSGLDVVLIDATAEKADAGKQRVAEIATRMRVAEDARQTLLARVMATTDYEDLSGCGMVIEAVFENRDVKAAVMEKVLPWLADDAVIASNTSTLPITGLAELVTHPERFIGMHFFSPVERMPLLEIILGEKTSDTTLAHAMDVAQRLRKVPIVVNDSPGFYTSRIFCAYVDEAMAMLTEGVEPALIENAARMAGFAASPLAVLDEVSLDLQKLVVDQAIADGLPARFLRSHAQPVIEQMNELGRLGRKSGGGFYDFPNDGKKHLWAGLSEVFPVAETQPDVEEVKNRLLYIQTLESIRSMEEGVISAAEDADIGATLGLGFPTWTGGPISLIETVGAKHFIQTCEALEARYGSRFAVPEMIAGDAVSRFYSKVAA